MFLGVQGSSEQSLRNCGCFQEFSGLGRPSLWQWHFQDLGQGSLLRICARAPAPLQLTPDSKMNSLGSWWRCLGCFDSAQGRRDSAQGRWWHVMEDVLVPQWEVRRVSPVTTHINKGKISSRELPKSDMLLMRQPLALLSAGSSNP